MLQPAPVKNKWLYGLVFLFSVGLVLFPFIALCFFVHPCADDFEFSKWTNFFVQNLHYYTQWSGRYFSTFVLSLSPVHWHSFFGYKVWSAAFILFFAGSLYVFTKKWVQAFVALDFVVIHIIYIGALLLAFDSAPSLVEGFYWASSAVTYLFSSALFFLFLTHLIVVFHEKKYQTAFLLPLLLFCIIGGNESWMLLVDTTLLGILGYELYRRGERKAILMALGLLLWASVVSLIPLLSPGNAARHLQFMYDKDPNPAFSIAAFLPSQIGMLMFQDIKSPFFIIYIVITFLVLKRSHLKQAPIKFFPGLFILLVGLGLLLAPVSLITKQAPGRVLNVVIYVIISAFGYLLFSLPQYSKVFQKVVL
ncbi:MAG: hypothetical protein HQL13_04905, partial [Candidatus Omnitrophica bacterium]|nr:hypothetical protein [Candidatus Omnitrophota bacterium]